MGEGQHYEPEKLEDARMAAIMRDILLDAEMSVR